MTSTLPENIAAGVRVRGKIKRGKIVPDQRTHEPESVGENRPPDQGKTQTINFYNINGDLYYVDLPGYGYAKVAQSEKVKWGRGRSRIISISPRC